MGRLTMRRYVRLVRRRRLKLSQQAFADLVGVSIVTVSRWETGVSVPHPLAMRRIKELAGYGNTRHGVLDGRSALADRSGDVDAGQVPTTAQPTVPAGRLSQAATKRVGISYDINLPFEAERAKRWKQNKSFPYKTIKAFEAYIRHSALPASDRLLLATMICQVAPALNERFDREAFLKGCQLNQNIAELLQPTTKESTDGSVTERTGHEHDSDITDTRERGNS